MRVSMFSVLVAGMMAILLCPGVRADDEEEAVAIDKLPKAVVDSIRKMFPDAELKKATKDVVKEEEEDDDDDDDKAADTKDDGNEEDKDDDDDKAADTKDDGKEEDKDEQDESKVVYEVTLSQKGHVIDVTVEEDGEIEEVERSIDLKELPKIVTDALARKFPKSTLKSAEAIYEVEDEKMELEGYEVILTSADGKEIEADIDVEIEITVD